MAATMTNRDAKFDALLRERLGPLYLGWTGQGYAATIGGGFVPRPGNPSKRGYVVHHTAGTATETGADIWRYHTKVVPWTDSAGVRRRGWATVGYGVFVRADGRVELLVPPSWMSFSVGALNPFYFAVCCAGNLDVNEPPPQQLRSLYRVLCACDDALGDNKWVAHREAMPGHTACPGRHLHAHLKEMRGPKWGAKVPRPDDYV